MTVGHKQCRTIDLEHRTDGAILNAHLIACKSIVRPNPEPGASIAGPRSALTAKVSADSCLVTLGRFVCEHRRCDIATQSSRRGDTSPLRFCSPFTARAECRDAHKLR
ncbi:hypothetical protein EVAR_97737_1 [Eumeta japonica]|uniref:Uncharacterized protein n=1 Tax=Eumeta variegata TaxID=151549 RepID=A0A4C1XAD1_EUMVA|nr:hypothetical protein EVAR_97737_1 [Eumeta japonica]